MTRAEQDRSLLRAFGVAARQLHAHAAIALYQHENAVARVNDRPTAGNRRDRTFARHYAHAIATAWGL